MQFGVNVGGTNYYSTELAWNNLFKRCRIVSNATGQQWGQGGPITSDANGYPTVLSSGQTPTYLIFDGVPGSYYPTGQYTFRWDGTGTFSLMFGSGTVVSSSANEIVWNITSGSNFFIQQNSTGAGANYAKNFRLYYGAPGTVNESVKYNQEWIGYLSNFSVIRFLDYLSTNHNPLVNWVDRPTTNSISWASEKGAPYETAIEIALAAGASPWINIPHGASDDFVTQLCNLINSMVPANGSVILEYTNEFWNGIFAQAQYCSQQGEAAGLGTGFVASARFYGRRMKQIAEIAKSILGPKVKVAAGTQVSNSGVSDLILDFENAYQSVDYLATAPYFGNPVTQASRENEILAMTQAQINTEIRNHLPTLENLMIVHQNKINTKWQNLKLTMYEFGSHLYSSVFSASSVTPIYNKFLEFTRSSLMRDLYLDYYDLMVPYTEIACHYAMVNGPSSFGFWSLMDRLGLTVGDSRRLRYDATLEWIAENINGETPANRPPTAFLNANPTSGAAPLTVNFSATGSSDPDEGDYILGYSWDFGDETALSFQNAPSHTYTLPGTYTATLIVQDSQLLASSPTYQTITVTAAPSNGNGNTALTLDQEDQAGRIATISGLTKLQVIDTAIELVKGMRQVTGSLDDLL